MPPPRIARGASGSPPRVREGPGERARKRLPVREQLLDHAEQIAWTEGLGQILGKSGVQGALAIFLGGVRSHGDDG